ncbi:PTS sugar transporter [Enterococcus sp. DIV0876]|uniref:PTS sugar transporter n=1 Tax=Enterococcus sp. DIV0876 TaxID=2774633 RepID=UPI003D2FCDD1
MKSELATREKMDTLKFYTNYLSRMMMPNLSIFIAWMIISFVLSQLNIEPIYIQKVEKGILQLVLPLMIAYTGGELQSRGRGGIAAVVAVFGLILMTDAPQVFGAMALGPSAGWLIKHLDQLMKDKVRVGYEMITANVSVGVIGSLLFLVSYFLLAPLFEGISQASYQVVDFFVRNNVFAGIHLILEPMKVFFFNNIINHGLLTPLGIEDAAVHGSSLLFLIETNPGPGMGVLIAYCWLGAKTIRTNAATALVVQALGGIHEVYFPFVLLHPALFVAPIIGGGSGTLIFQLFDAGLKAPASPGSLLIIMANAPLSKMLGIFAGITVSTIVSFSIASVILKRPQKNHEVKNMSNRKQITEIIVACDAGMGSSAIGASILKRQLQEAQLSIPVRYESIYRVDDQAHILLVTQKELAAIAQKKAPHAQHFHVENFLAKEEYTGLIDQIKTGDYVAPVSFIPPSTGAISLVFLYEGTVRGSQTMAVELVKKMALETRISIEISKAPLENVSFTQDTVYIISEELAQKVATEGVRLFVVKDILQIEQYRQLLTEGVDYVLNQT